MNFKSPLEATQFLYQIRNLYESSGTYGTYDVVYDKLKEDGHDIKFEQSVKDELWDKARKKFKKENKRLIEDFKKNKWPEERLKHHLHRYFKSFLVTKYILDKMEEQGIKLILMNDVTGKEIKPLDIVGYE